jgi:hypothetical protein
VRFAEIELALLSKNGAHRVLPAYLKPTDDVPWFLLQEHRPGIGRFPFFFSVVAKDFDDSRQYSGRGNDTTGVGGQWTTNLT